MAEELDVKMNRKEALNHLLSSGGFQIFLEEMKNLTIGVESQLDSMMHQAVNQDKLAQMNFHLGKKKGYEIVLEVLDSFKEELEERE